jgi:hypothetical protein
MTMLPYRPAYVFVKVTYTFNDAVRPEISRVDATREWIESRCGVKSSII